MRAYQELRLILGDQLNQHHSWFEKVDDSKLYVIMEVKSETDYVRHHIQKVIGFFLAMRAFRDYLQKRGHNVLYIQLDDQRNQHSFSKNLAWIIRDYNIQQWAYLLPDEYRLDQELSGAAESLGLPFEVTDTEHFLSERDTVETLFKGKKTYLMETFYRKMRTDYNIMMEEDGKTPYSGRWNYDAENRKKLPKKQGIPETPSFSRNVEELMQWLAENGIATIGTVDAQDYNWPVTRIEALQLLKHFIENRLCLFGTYQDAMTTRDNLLFHSKLSFCLNAKLISPLEVVQACVAYWTEDPERIAIAQIEGFVRQIIGWREYMRGVYWAKMPGYAQMNYFNHTAKLPDFYWTGKTKMKCLQHAIGQSLSDAYAHHIQRLMVTGNFALLLGVHPDEVDEWYLGIYMDAVQWVEITNTRGMSQFADGGIVGTKPYVSSANYINKMSDYCKDCYYNNKQRYGELACPFNSLYWAFFDRHEDKLRKNPRIGMAYRIWDRTGAVEQEKILAQARYYMEHVEEL